MAALLLPLLLALGLAKPAALLALNMTFNPRTGTLRWSCPENATETWCQLEQLHNNEQIKMVRRGSQGCTARVGG